jgi:hypothetical protein
MHRREILALALLALAGCGGPGDPDAGSTDAPRGDSATVFDGTLELGEGEATFRPVTDGDTLLIARGCQGSQHVWITLRTQMLDPRGATVRLTLTRASDGSAASLEFFVRLSFTPDPGGAFAELRALTLQIPTPDDVIGEDLILTGEVVDRAGHGARAMRTVRVDWGTEVCGG